MPESRCQFDEGTGMQEEPDIFANVVIDGIDTYEGKQRFSADVYMELLRAWCRHVPASLEKLRCLAKNLPDKAKLEEYKITIHALKGSNYGIRAGGIGHDAKKLEAASLHGDIDFIFANTEPFIEKSMLLHTCLEKFLSANPKQVEKKYTVVAPDPKLLAELFIASKRFKFSRMEEIITKLEEAEYETGGDLVVWLRRQLDNLEYAAIQERLATELGEKNPAG